MIDIVCVIDKSGSMHPLTDETIGSFNGFLQEQKALAGEARMTLVLFDNYVNTVFVKKPLRLVLPLDHKSYVTGGTTALLQAVATTIKLMDDSEKVIFMIITDGHENSSGVEYTSQLIKDEIYKKERMGWQFHYLGVGVNDFDDAMGMGISATRSYNFDHDAKGLRSVYAAASTATLSYREENS